MKKLFFMPLMATALIFAGCSDDDDNGGGPPAGPATVVGEWRATTVIASFDAGELGTFDETYPTSACDEEIIAVFTAEGTFETLDFEIDSDFETEEVECEIGEMITGTYEQVDGNTYTLTYTSGEDEGEEDEVQLILSNNNNTLDVVFEDLFGTFTIRHTRQ